MVIVFFCNFAGENFLNMKQIQNIVDYLLEWLLDSKDLASQVVYSDNPDEYKGKRLAIVPSDFFSNNVYLTQESLVKKVKYYLQFRGWIDGMEDNKYIPVLLGTDQIVEQDGCIVLHADIIASTFYLLTRYEELVNPVRDEYGRFPAKESFLARVGMLHYPIVDEYSDYLRSLLGIEPRRRKLQKIFLTHDVDTVAFYRHLRGFAGGIKRFEFRAAVKAQKGLVDDAAYTFPWLIENDSRITNAEQIYFLKAGIKSEGFDYPMYDLQGADVQQLLLLLANNNISIGLHCSYASGANSSLISDEKNRLQQVVGKTIKRTRYHYLRTCSVDDYQALADIGVAEDFTMGFAQLAGFRLGTCRPVRWINPRTLEVTNLVLHHLTAMDCSLSDYMKLDADDSFRYVRDLIEQAAYHGGEISLLWHNSVFAHQTWQKDIYLRLLAYLKTIQ